jgi:hypothetical protein
MRFEFWIQMGVMLLMEALHDTVKNPESKMKFKASFLKVHRSLKKADASIVAEYADDPDFQEGTL